MTCMQKLNGPTNVRRLLLLLGALAFSALAPAQTGTVKTGHDLSVPALCVTTNSGNAYSCTTAPSFTPIAGDQVLASFNAVNTGSATLNVNSTSAAAIYKQANRAALQAGDLQSGHYTRLTYDGSHWQIEGQVGSDFPEVLTIPAANCNNATPGAGWSLPSSGAPTPACRTGTNVQGGVLEFAASNSAQFQLDIPGDYDSSGTVYAKIYFTQGAYTTTAKTIILQIATGCSATTDDPSFNTAQVFATATTGTTANTPYTETLSTVTMTGCVAGGNMNVKISRSGSDTDTGTGTSLPSVYWVALTFPRLVVNQAN